MLGGEGVEFGVYCPFLGGWFLPFPTSPSLAGARVSGWGWGQRKPEDISCLADCAGLINVPKH